MFTFTKQELDKIAAEIKASAVRALELSGYQATDQDWSRITTSIGANASMAVAEVISSMAPSLATNDVTGARAAIWAQEERAPTSIGRAGVSPSQLREIERTVGSDADGALALLEARLFALFLAVRRVRGERPRPAKPTPTDYHRGRDCNACGGICRYPAIGIDPITGAHYFGG